MPFPDAEEVFNIEAIQFTVWLQSLSLLDMFLHMVCMTQNTATTRCRTLLCCLFLCHASVHASIQARSSNGVAGNTSAIKLSQA